MSTNTINTWEEMREHYKIIDMTIDRRPPYYDLEGNRRCGIERIELDFGSPDIDFAGVTKIEYFVRMMAAAPDMLSSLETILDEGEEMMRFYNAVLNSARESIAKAKGEQP